MAKVIATQRGYFDRTLREPGDLFSVPDDIMEDPNRRPSWVEPVSDSQVEDSRAEGLEPDALAGDAAKPRGGRKARAETVTAPTAAPFADAPEPVRVSNEINTATGGTQPDWIASDADI